MRIRMCESYDYDYDDTREEAQLQVDFQTDGSYDSECVEDVLIDALENTSLRGNIRPAYNVAFDRVKDGAYDVDDGKYVACALIDFSHNGDIDEQQIEREVFYELDSLMGVDCLGTYIYGM